MPSLLSARMQDYLEAVLLLERDNPVTRPGEIAEQLGVSNPTVTAALKKLADEGYVEHESYGYVRLTERGQKAAQAVARRHRLLKEFLHRVLGVGEERAAEDACRLEHHISSESAERLASFVRFLDVCPRAGKDLLERFRCFTGDGPGPRGRESNCRERCLAECVAELQEHGCPPCPRSDD